jgi:hypothetical protein
MNRSCRLALLCVALLPLVTAPVLGQGLTGTLVGTVKDPQGGVLSGAIVRVASPALIGGDQQTTTNERGQWRFPSLAPGTYALTIEMAPTFASFRAEAIRLGPGATVEQDAVLGLAGVTQTVTVESTSSERQSGLSSRFRSDYVDTIPTTRNSMFDLIRSAPGVSPTSPASRTTNSVSVFGSAVNENTFLIDGTNFTCPCQGVSRAEPIVDVIQEVQVQSAGASVEYGNMQGGVFNVVTKQGGNRFRGNASQYAQWSDLTAQPVVLPVTRGTVPTSGYERERYRDFTATVGGPIVRDRVWFFGAYQYLRDYDSQPGTDPAFPRTYEQNKGFGKVNWRASNSLQLMSSFHEEVWVNPTPPTLATPFVATTRVNARVPNSTFVQVTHTPSSSTMWEARAGRFITRQRNDPASGDRSTAPRRDQLTGVSSGNAATIGGPVIDRVTAKAVVNHYRSAWLGLDHALKAGVQIERGQHRNVTVIPGGVQYVDNGGAPFQAVYRDPSITGGRFITSSVFGSDSFTMRNRVTIDAGLRLDHSAASSQDLPALDARGVETSSVINGAGHLFTWDVWSPRLGVSAKLTDDGRTTLRASYGRFNQGVLTGELDPIHPGITSTTTRAYDAATGGYTTLVSVVDPKRNLSLDREMRTPNTDEYSVALDRELGTGLRASAAYIRKRGRDFIGWTDTGGQYRQETRTLSNGMVVPVQVLTNATSDRRFLLTNPDGLFLHYDGVVLATEKRSGGRWQASGSYTYSKAYGTLVTSNAPAAEAQFSTIARPAFLAFGQDPNDLTNTPGRLPNDRPHVFRTTGSANLPFGLLAAANFQYFTGRPWAATAQITLPQGSQRILVEPRGGHRLAAQSLLDLRLSKSMHLGSGGSVDVLFDVLNALNDSAEEAVQTDNILAATFGRATQFMDPRRAMVGVRLNLGR